MNQALENRFCKELVTLNSLFERKEIEYKLTRIKEIHEYTEAKWHEYTNLCENFVVRYLLIAEAPPWSSEGTPEYLLDPISRVRTLMRALKKTFPGAQNGSSAESLKVLATQGFLLLDSIPFAMEYSTKRNSEKYDDLISLTAVSYLQWKIDSLKIKCSPQIRIAFAVKRNALSILRAIKYLSIGGRRYPLSTQMIAVNGAGYPDAMKLQWIYGLRTDKAE